MTTVRFPLEAVLQHSLHVEGSVAPSLLLVKDQGAYIMSNGPLPNRPEVVYGILPDGTVLNGEGETWDIGQDLFGGDDFGEVLPLGELFDSANLTEALKQGEKYVTLDITEEQFLFGLSKR